MADRDRSRTTVFRAGGYRWLLISIAFIVGASLLVGASAFVLYLVTEHGGDVIGSERRRSQLALALFISLIAIPTYLLAIANSRAE